MCAHSQARASVEQPLSVVLPGGAQPALEGRGGVWWVSVGAGREGGGRGLPAGSFTGNKGGQGDFWCGSRVRLEGRAAGLRVGLG